MCRTEKGVYGEHGKKKKKNNNEAKKTQSPVKKMVTDSKRMETICRSAVDVWHLASGETAGRKERCGKIKVGKDAQSIEIVKRVKHEKSDDDKKWADRNSFETYCSSKHDEPFEGEKSESLNRLWKLRTVRFWTSALSFEANRAANIRQSHDEITKKENNRAGEREGFWHCRMHHLPERDRAKKSIADEKVVNFSIDLSKQNRSNPIGIG